VAYYMFTASPRPGRPIAGCRAADVPGHVYFSAQARKAFRRSRKEIGNVNAELQESIAAVREVQAFSRADENIEQFKKSTPPIAMPTFAL